MLSGAALRTAGRAVDDGARSLSSGDVAAAERAYAKALGKVGKLVGKAPPAAGLAAAAHVGLGRVRLAYHDFRAADPEFSAAQRLQPMDWSGFYWAGCGAAHQADFRRADWCFTAALRNQAPPRTFKQRGFVRVRLGQVEEAIGDLERAAGLSALDDDAFVLLAALHLHRRDWARAEAALVAIPDGRRPPATAGMLASALERQGKDGPALAAYQLAIEGGDLSQAVLFHHGLVAYRLGRFADCVWSWTELCVRHPLGASYRRLVAHAQYAMAYESVRGGRFEAALPHLVAGTDAHPAGTLDTEVVRMYRYAAAEAAHAGDETGRARARTLLAAAGLGANDPWARAFLVLLDRLDGRRAAAEHEWHRIIRQSPGDPRTLFALGLSAVQQGEVSMPLTTFTVLAHDDDNVVTRRSRRALAALRIRRGEWAAAVDVLAALPAGDGWRERLLPECAYRAGDPAGELGPWHSAVSAGAGDADGAVRALAEPDAPPRLRRELTLLVCRAALTEVAGGRWASAAHLLSVDGVAETAELELSLHGAVRLLGGRRADGLRLLAEASRRDPLNRRLTHTLALARLHTVSAEQSPADLDWRGCIASWVSVLHDDSFWTGVVSDAARRYGVPVPSDVVGPLRIGLRDLLVHRLPSNRSDSATADPTWLFQRELAAAEVLATSGGLPLADETADDDMVVCGPLRLVELGLHREFGDLVMETVDEMADDAAQWSHVDFPGAQRQFTALTDVRNELRRCFSQLGFAHCLLIAGQPADALTELSDLRCPDCRARPVANPPEPHRDSAWPLTCAPDCARFELENPAFATLADGREQLARDGVELAVDALFALSQIKLTSAEPDLDEVRASWRRAVIAADGIDIADVVQQRLADLAMGRADTLDRRDRLPQAIAVLEAALEVLDTSGPRVPDIRDRVAGQLASLVADRGIRVANKNMDDAAIAIPDLRYAIKLNPHLVRARVALIVLTRRDALRLFERGDVTGTLEAFGVAAELAEDGLRQAPGHGELTQLLTTVHNERDQLWSAVAEAVARASRRR